MDNGLFVKELGSRIRAARKARKMTLTRLSELTKIDIANLCQLELYGKNAHILTLKAIADNLGIDVKDLLS